MTAPDQTPPATPEDTIVLALDLEATGTDPEVDKILEVAMFPVNLRTLERTHKGVSFVVRHPKDSLRLHPDVVDMHRANGLLADIEKSRAGYSSGVDFVDPSGLDCEIRARIFSMGWVRWGDRPMLMGNTVHFDLDFLRHHCPETAALLHHRVIDVSTFRETAKSWGVPVLNGDKAHRAMADCESSLAQLQWYRSYFQYTCPPALVVHPQERKALPDFVPEKIGPDCFGGSDLP